MAKLEWYWTGYISRFKDEKAYLNGTQADRDSQRKPPTRWTDNIKQTISKNWRWQKTV